MENKEDLQTSTIVSRIVSFMFNGEILKPSKVMEFTLRTHLL